MGINKIAERSKRQIQVEIIFTGKIWLVMDIFNFRIM